MPIRPEDRARYPADWPEISRRIREDRAQGRCECTGQCGADHAHRCAAEHGQAHPVTGSIVVLTVAHLDRTPEHNGGANLCAMCQDCHLAYDLEDHVAQGLWTRSQRRLEERRNHELFPLPLGHVGARKAPEPTLPHAWRVRPLPGKRMSLPCRIIGRGKLNTLLVELEDGTHHLVTRHALRARRVGPRP